MRYEIEVGGRVRIVQVERRGDRFVVDVDGRAWDLDVAPGIGHSFSLLVNESGNGTAAAPLQREVMVVPEGTGGNLTAYVGSTPVAIAVNGRRRVGDASAGVRPDGPERILAPMPGKVVRTYVKPGDTVTARQPLLVVEAMKMENELRAGRPGVVAELHAREGLSVDAGALLIVIR